MLSIAFQHEHLPSWELGIQKQSLEAPYIIIEWDEQAIDNSKDWICELCTESAKDVSGKDSDQGSDRTHFQKTLLFFLKHIDVCQLPRGERRAIQVHTRILKACRM